MNPGRLNKRITFCRYTESVNELKQTVQQLEPYKTVWASVEPLKGREYLEAQKVQPELTYRITTRYHRDIAPDMIIKYQGRELNIQNIVNPYERDEKLEIYCVEKVGANGI